MQKEFDKEALETLMQTKTAGVEPNSTTFTIIKFFNYIKIFEYIKILLFKIL